MGAKCGLKIRIPSKNYRDVGVTAVANVKVCVGSRTFTPKIRNESGKWSTIGCHCRLPSKSANFETLLFQVSVLQLQDVPTQYTIFDNGQMAVRGAQVVTAVQSNAEERSQRAFSSLSRSAEIFSRNRFVYLSLETARLVLTHKCKRFSLSTHKGNAEWRHLQ